MNSIQKPEANPVVSALLTLLILNLGHVIINGQAKKWAMIFLATIIGTFLCVLPGLVIWILSVLDSYQTAERLRAGEEIPENEYTNPTLYKICRIIDKSASCKNAS